MNEKLKLLYGRREEERQWESREEVCGGDGGWWMVVASLCYVGGKLGRTVALGKVIYGSLSTRSWLVCTLHRGAAGVVVVVQHLRGGWLRWDLPEAGLA